MANTDDIRWKHISAEAFAIVVSILLAFWIDAWWEERKDRFAEQEYLSAILADIDVVIGEVDRTIAANETLNKSARHRIAALRDGYQLSDATEATMLEEIWTSYRLRANLDSYTDLLSSGGVMILRSSSVRGTLARLRSEMDFEQELFQMTIEAAEMSRPLLHESLDAGNMTIIARLEKDTISSREIHNARKSEVRDAANEARDAVLSAISGSSN